MSSWLYKLRRKRSAVASQKREKPAPPPPPSPKTPCSPNRESYYFPSRSRRRDALSPKQQDNPKLRDTRFPQPRPGDGDIVFDVVARRDARFGVDEAMAHELKLRPILTRPANRGKASDSDISSGGGTASPTARVRQRRVVHARNKAVAERRLRWVYESVVVVKESKEPEEDFLASMREMIAANHHHDLEGLLACYLALNAPDHHRAIVAAFRRACLDSLPPHPPRERRRCHLHARCT